VNYSTHSSIIFVQQSMGVIKREKTPKDERK